MLNFDFASQFGAFDPTRVPQIVVGVILFILVGLFVARFYIPALRLNRSLDSAVKNLRAHTNREDWDLKECFETNEDLKHAWSEYAETLHKPSRFDPATQTVIKSIPRSTVPAEVVFSPQQIVDPQLNVEFFRHLPGVFTGIGIIGTFLGLIIGLSSFKISTDPLVVQMRNCF